MDLIKQLISEYRHAHGGAAIALAVVRPHETIEIVEGASQETRFEIGSISKVFTAILLAQSVIDGEAGLEDSLSKHLRSVRQKTTLRDLLNHASGYPRLPISMILLWESFKTQPYQNWTRSRLKRHVILPTLSPSGERFAYSNLGFAILGQVVEAIRHRPYGELVAEWAAAHRMPDTSTEPKTEDRVGIKANGRRVEPWKMAAFESAGGIRSTIRDMATFVKLCLEETPEPAIALTLSETRTLSTKRGWREILRVCAFLLPLLLAFAWFSPEELLGPTVLLVIASHLGGWTSCLGLGLIWTCLVFAHGTDQHGLMATLITAILVLLARRERLARSVTVGLGWHVADFDGSPVYWHNGGTAGFRSYLGFSRKHRAGLVVLSSCEASVDDLGVQLLKSAISPHEL